MVILNPDKVPISELGHESCSEGLIYSLICRLVGARDFDLMRLVIEQGP